MIYKLPLAALAVLLSGCAGIDTVNGVRMNATTAPDATYCDRNPAICVMFGAAVVGGLGAIFAGSINHHHSQSSQSTNTCQSNCAPT